MDHVVGLALSLYIAAADSVLTSILRRLLKGRDNDELLVHVASDWGFRTAAAGLCVELLFAFRTNETILERLGFFGAVVGVLLLWWSTRVDVGELFRHRVFPYWSPLRPSLGRLLQVFLIGSAGLLLAKLLTGAASH